MDQIENIPSEKKSNKKWFVIGTVVVLLITGFVMYPWVRARLKLYVIQNEFSVTNHPELALVPTPLDLTTANVSNSQQFSYYGITFDVPWQEAPKIVTPNEKFGTRLSFSGGQFIVLLASSVYADVPTNILSSIPGLDIAKIESAYGRSITSSSYDFFFAALNTTPSSADALQFILPFKYAIFSGFDKPLALYSFSLSTTKGIEIVWQNETANQVYRHHFLFDAQGRGTRELTIVGATESEAESILASIRMN